MNYIVDPKVFYWIGVVNSLKAVLVILSLGFGALVVIMIVCYLSSFDFYDDDDDEPKRYRRWLISSVACLIPCVLLAVFIPGRDAIIAMQVARLATYDNAAWTVESLKAAVDYVVEAISKLK